jgi:hypothetical protein
MLALLAIGSVTCAEATILSSTSAAAAGRYHVVDLAVSAVLVPAARHGPLAACLPGQPGHHLDAELPRLGLRSGHVVIMTAATAPAPGQPEAWRDTGKLPATAGDQPPGDDPGLVKISVPEARRHQARARWHHYHAQLLKVARVSQYHSRTS